MLPLQLDPAQLRMILEAIAKLTGEIHRLNDALEGRQREGGGS